MTENKNVVVPTYRIPLWGRLILCIIFPPLAVFDKGCLSVGLVYLLTLLGIGSGVLFGLFFFSFLTGWIPAGLVAMLICVISTKQTPNAVADTELPMQENPSADQHNFHDILELVIRGLLCLFCPPLAVVDKGCGAPLYVLLFWPFGWLPGTILAFLICYKDKKYF